MLTSKSASPDGQTRETGMILFTSPTLVACIAIGAIVCIVLASGHNKAGLAQAGIAAVSAVTLTAIGAIGRQFRNRRTRAARSEPPDQSG